MKSSALKNLLFPNTARLDEFFDHTTMLCVPYLSNPWPHEIPPCDRMNPFPLQDKKFKTQTPTLLNRSGSYEM